ncbi:hypothetical protein KC926_00080 [Candidatus Kaiserbacteria bacterium]|nr:hypothetical protein [Candidatus Kaiserbacteria bacterium]
MNVQKKHLQILLLILPVFLLTPSFAFADVYGGVQELIWSFVNNFFGLLAGWGGLLLNAGVTSFVVGFGDSFLNSGVGVVVDKLWVNVRDIFNLTFIFGLVYIGFKMILDSDDSSTRKWLINLILAALLVNFSLYITKFVVDLTNILASQIATQGFVTDASKGVLVSDTFMSHLGLPSIWGGDGSSSLPKNLQGTSGAWGYIMGTAILFMVAAFVFAAGGILLIIRYAVLCVYMVLSPLMFLGWVFPSLQSKSSEYWKGFLGRAFFAPAYLLLIYFASQIIAGFYGTGGSQKKVDFQGSMSGSGDTIAGTFSATIPPFILSCVFLIAALVVGTKLGANGADTALKMGNNLRGRVQRGVGAAAGGATFGAGAWAMRNTVGAQAYKMSQDEKWKARASRTYLGKKFFQSTQAVAGASFDARNVGGVGKNLSIGQGKKGGYAKHIDDTVKANQKFVESIKTNADLSNPETQAAIAVDAAKIAAEANAATPALKARQDRLNKNQEILKKSDIEATAELTSDIQDLDASIASLTQELSGNNLTSDERKEKERMLAEDTGSKLANTESLAIVKERAAERAKVADIEAKGDSASTAERQALEDSKKRVAAIEQKFTNVQATAAVQLKTMEDKAKNAHKEAEAKVKYANEIAYMEYLAKTQSKWSDMTNQASAGIAGSGAGSASGIAAGLGGAAAVGTMGAAGILAISAMNERSDVYKAMHADMVKKYGVNGMKGMENEANAAMARTIAQQLIEQGGANTVPPAPAPASE